MKPAAFGASVTDANANSTQESQDSDNVISTSVAIKVLHPRVHQTIRRDIAIMNIFAQALNALPGMEWLSLPDEVAVFGEMMNSQLDLRVEGANLDRFDRNFRTRGRNVTFPLPIKLGQVDNGTAREESKEVLMEEFEDALPLKYFLRQGGGPFDEKIATIGLDAFLVGFAPYTGMKAYSRKCSCSTTGPMEICIRKLDQLAPGSR